MKNLWGKLKEESLFDLKEYESYEAWREEFVYLRIHFITIIAVIVVPFFLIPDNLLFPAHLKSFIIIRAVFELGIIVNLLLLRRYKNIVGTDFFLLSFLLIAGLSVSQMTVLVQGFTSVYYQGMNLVFLGIAFIVPAKWRIHLIGQVLVLSHYYVSNLFFAPSEPDLRAAVGNSFFLVISSVCILVAVFLYERLQKTEFHKGKELELTNKKLVALDRLKSEFFANISHELRTPLTLILGGFNSLRHPDSPVHTQEIIDAGLRNSGRLLFLINELLDLAKFESGRAELHKRSFDIGALLRNVAAQFESSHTRRIHFRGRTQPVVLEADAEQLKKVFTNLLANAFKFNEAPDPQVWLRLNARDEWVELEVEDNGIGIPPEHLPNIFDRFTQVEGHATRRYEGSGIGLALVKEIVTRHGGTIQVESEPGHGSTFTLTLPRGHPGTPEDLGALDKDNAFMIPRSSAPPEASPSILPSSQVSPNRPLILVVEDNPDMQRYVARILSTQYRVAVAKDGVEGLEQARALRPELILTDMMMPLHGWG